MKKFITSTILISVILFESCEPAATFDKPQPDNQKPLTNFPERLQGRFLASDQASILTIADKLITRQYDFDIKEHKDSLGTSYKVVGDTLIYLTDGTKEKIVLKGDTVFQHENWTDTLFKISADNVLKKFKGYYILNNRYSDSAWEVKKLSWNKGMLTVATISDINDLQKLKEITETTDDTTSTYFSLTRRQFKSFIRQDGFGEQETFTRLKENGR